MSAVYPSRLAEPVIGPRFARTRWLAPQDDGFDISVPTQLEAIPIYNPAGTA